MIRKSDQTLENAENSDIADIAFFFIGVSFSTSISTYCWNYISQRSVFLRWNLFVFMRWNYTPKILDYYRWNLHIVLNCWKFFTSCVTSAETLLGFYAQKLFNVKVITLRVNDLFKFANQKYGPWSLSM